MASTLLQVKALSGPPLYNICGGSPLQSGRIRGSRSAFWIRQESPRDFSVKGLPRSGRWGVFKTRWGVDLGVVGTSRASAEDTTGSVAVENISDDVSGDASEDVSEEISEEISEDVSENVSEEEQLSPEDEEDRQNIQDILRVVDLLRTKRDMTFNEVRLTIMIEDPRDVERRKMLNIEDERGCSREEMGNALLEVHEGRIPQDKITLRELAKEMLAWPNLEEEIAAEQRLPPVASPYAKVTDTGVDPRLAAERAKVDWDSAADILPGGEKKEMSENLPPAVGFSFLYLISSLPVIIGIVVVAILFLNSLQ